MLLEPANRKPCVGWQRYVMALKRRGFFVNADYLTIRKVVARRALYMLESFTSAASPDDKEYARIELKRCMKFITVKDIGPLEIPL